MDRTTRIPRAPRGLTILAASGLLLAAAVGSATARADAKLDVEDAAGILVGLDDERAPDRAPAVVADDADEDDVATEENEAAEPDADDVETPEAPEPPEADDDDVETPEAPDPPEADDDEPDEDEDEDDDREEDEADEDDEADEPEEDEPEEDDD